MAAKPWNFPTYLALKQAYQNSGWDGDPFYQNAGGAADWNDVGDFTWIGAVLLPPGFAQTGQNQTTTGQVNAYTPLFSVSDYASGHDQEYCFRTHYTHSTNEYGLQFFMYDGTTYKGVMTLNRSTLESTLGYNFEDGVMLQVALSVQASTGKRICYINGVEVYNNTTTSWGSMGLHSGGNDARAAFNYYAASTSFTSTGQGGTCIWGPCGIDDAFLDIADPAVRANIFDDNGDFLWAGNDGSEWFGYQPWYYSPIGVPYHGNKGTNTGTWLRPTTSSGTVWGYPCGSKWDWPTELPEWLSLTKAMPGLKGYWHFYSLHEPQNYFITNPVTQNGFLRRYTTAGGSPGRPHRDGEAGSLQFYEAYSSPAGYVQAQTTMGDLIKLQNYAWMTICMDLTLEPTDNFGFQKVIGWRSASSSSTFGVYTTYPNGNGRHLTLQFYGTDGVARYHSFTVPTNTKVLPVTWLFRDGVVTCISGLNTIRFNTDYSATFTQLRNTAGTWGFMDYTSAASGQFEASVSMAACGTGSDITNQEVFDLHAALLNGATG